LTWTPFEKRKKNVISRVVAVVVVIKQEKKRNRNEKDDKLIDHMLDRSAEFLSLRGQRQQTNERRYQKTRWIGLRRLWRRLGNANDRANTFRREFDLAVAQMQNNKIKIKKNGRNLRDQR
jgi:hypothetical protein